MSRYSRMISACEVSSNKSSYCPTALANALAAPTVVGGLLGTQVGREVEIMNTFELVINKAEDSDELTVDHGYFVTRAEQCE